MSEQRLQINLPQEQNGGVFADFVRAWHTSDAFVLDFASLTQPPHSAEPGGPVILDASVVARVRIPPAQVFELMKALEQQLSSWEKERGSRPETRS
ncbi:MAG: DUF3467 domain-containing protein [Bifidobacteriaceae bacterium]|jgi:hypothetical protein|nr:DUF3467 domain-containing protein [Bifidobacteriaceae bacterium]